MTSASTTLPKRNLGDTGITVSCLGLGTVKIGRNQGVKYPSEFELPSDADVRNLLATAHDAGINLLDTAPAYGSSEERLGKLLSERDKWVLCSKTGEEFVNGQSLFDFSAAYTQLSVERSLKRLKTDYLDLVLIHSDGNDEQIIRQTDCLETLAKLKEKGLIRAFGLSGKTVEGGLLALQYADVVMVTCNPQETAEIEVIKEAHQLNKGVLIKKALGSGHAVVGDVKADAKAEPVADAMRFIFSQDGVSAIIIGSINPEHVLKNIKTAKQAIEKLPALPRQRFSTAC